jgi:hypothetical protein
MSKYGDDTLNETEWDNTSPKPIFPTWRIDTPLEEIIGNAVGAASTCWKHVEKAGVFQSERASQIVDEVVANIRKKLFFDGETKPEKPNLGYATTRELLEEIKARGEILAAVGEYSEEMGDMAIGAANLLESLPWMMLDYKTVDGG